MLIWVFSSGSRYLPWFRLYNILQWPSPSPSGSNEKKHLRHTHLLCTDVQYKGSPFHAHILSLTHYPYVKNCLPLTALCLFWFSCPEPLRKGTFSSKVCREKNYVLQISLHMPAQPHITDIIILLLSM